MTAWATFWTWFLAFSVTLFLGLAIVITIGSAFDIRAMFRTIRKSRDGE